MKCTSYNKFFEVISGKTRLKIIESLFKKPRSVNEISESISEEQSKVSHNLKVLFECNFVKREKKGKKHIYSLNSATITPLLKAVDKHVEMNCGGHCHGLSR